MGLEIPHCIRDDRSLFIGGEEAVIPLISIFSFTGNYDKGESSL
jgi:hypothetical protein